MAEDTTEVKDSPPTQTSFRHYAQKRGLNPSELEASLKKQELIKETKNMEGMTPTPKAELKRESLVKLAAKLEGTTPEKVEEKLEPRKPPTPPIAGKERDYRLRNTLLMAEAADIQAQQRSQEAEQKSFERIQEKLKNREAVRQKERERQTKIAEALRPKTFTEMAAARRGNLPEKATPYHISEAKREGPLPNPQAKEPQTPTPKAEVLLRQQFQAPQPTPRESGIKRFFNKLLGRA